MVEYIRASSILLEQRKKGCDSPEKDQYLAERAKWLFKSGILRASQIKGGGIKKIKEYAVKSARIDPSVMDSLPKLKSFVKTLGLSLGTSCFLCGLKLVNFLKK